MDGGRGDCRMTGSNRKLVKIADDVPGGVEAFHRRLLIYVDLEITHLRADRRQPGRELGTDIASGRYSLGTAQWLGLVAVKNDRADGHSASRFSLLVLQAGARPVCQPPAAWPICR
jgi:hypothetical protein